LNVSVDRGDSTKDEGKIPGGRLTGELFKKYETGGDVKAEAKEIKGVCEHL